MLNPQALAQLSQLKQNFEAVKETLPATIKGTQSRFGFAVLDDGREAFLPPEQMDRLFPGDRAMVVVTPDSDREGRFIAEVESLISTELKRFCGRYEVRGKGHFVAPDLPRFSRWLFIPPSQRHKAKAGDLIEVEIARHPIKEGKALVNIVQVIGQPDQPGIETRYACVRYELPNQWSAACDKQIAELSERLPTLLAAREDATALPFLTIDSEKTQDIDDALYASRRGDQIEIQVAIADPAALIAAGSALDQEAARRAVSTYFPGQTLPMLPAALSHDLCSLLPGVSRLALVARFLVDPSGHCEAFEIREATIQSHHRLSYTQVSAHLDQQAPVADSALADQLVLLQEAAARLAQWRARHGLLMEDRPDYEYRLDEQGRIAEILRQEKNSAHQLVESFMVSSNRLMGEWLAARQTGLFVRHPGFKAERIPELQKWLSELQPALADLDLQSLEGYRTLIQSLAQIDSELPLRAILTRNLERSELVSDAAPHFGLGFAAYATFTSPIRKYSDLLIHRMVRAQLQQQSLTISEEQLQALRDGNQRSRQATWLAELSLKCEYAERVLQGQTLAGEIQMITSTGFSVRLHDSGIDVFVACKGLGEKFSFDPLRLTLDSATRHFQLQQAIEVKITEIDRQQRNLQGMPA